MVKDHFLFVDNAQKYFPTFNFFRNKISRAKMNRIQFCLAYFLNEAVF